MRKKIDKIAKNNEKIIKNKDENTNQALVKTIKKEKKEKIKIDTANNEKISFFSTGEDSVEKFSFAAKIETDDEKISVNLQDGSNNPKKRTKAKTKTETINQIIKNNQDAKITTTYSEEHFSMAFKGAKLLTPNVIFSALQYHKYDVFAYKKSWHIIISRELERLNAKIKKEKLKKLPFFTHSVEVVVFRQAPTLVDEDAVALMFKYIIDALKKDKNNPYGVLADDNPKIIFKTETFNEKGEHEVGIRLQFIPDNQKETYSLDKILEPRKLN